MLPRKSPVFSLFLLPVSIQAAAPGWSKLPFCLHVIPCVSDWEFMLCFYMRVALNLTLGWAELLELELCAWCWSLATLFENKKTGMKSRIGTTPPSDQGSVVSHVLWFNSAKKKENPDGERNKKPKKWLQQKRKDCSWHLKCKVMAMWWGEALKNDINRILSQGFCNEMWLFHKWKDGFPPC